MGQIIGLGLVARRFGQSIQVRTSFCCQRTSDFFSTTTSISIVRFFQKSSVKVNDTLLLHVFFHDLLAHVTWHSDHFIGVLASSTNAFNHQLFHRDDLEHVEICTQESIRFMVNICLELIRLLTALALAHDHFCGHPWNAGVKVRLLSARCASLTRVLTPTQSRTSCLVGSICGIIAALSQISFELFLLIHVQSLHDPYCSSLAEWFADRMCQTLSQTIRLMFFVWSSVHQLWTVSHSVNWWTSSTKETWPERVRSARSSTAFFENLIVCWAPKQVKRRLGVYGCCWFVSLSRFDTTGCSVDRQ